MRKFLFVAFVIFAVLGYAETSQFGTVSENTLQLEVSESSETKNELVDLLTSSMKKAGIKDDIIEDVLEDIRTGNLSNIIDMKSKASIDSDFSIDLRIDPYASPVDRYISTIKAAPSSVDLITQSVRMRQPAERITFKDISFDDFVVYSVLENMNITTSYTELSPGFKQASYKYKLRKKYPDETTLLDQFSNLKFKLPLDYTLEMINYEGTADNGLKKTQTIQAWKEEIGEKQLKKQWDNFVKQYNK